MTQILPYIVIICFAVMVLFGLDAARHDIKD